MTHSFFLGPIARTLETSYAANHMAGAGRADLATRPKRKFEFGGVKYAAIQGIDRFTWHHHTAAAYALNGLAHIVGGVRFVGIGANATVYARGTEVIKAYRSTVAMTNPERASYRQRRQELCTELGSILGDMVTPQSFSIGEHPLGRYQVVLGSQQFVHGQRLDLFTPGTTDLHEEAVYAYCKTHSNGISQLRSLAEGTFQSYDNARFVPDLNGKDNFRTGNFAMSRTLELVDAEPIPADEHPAVVNVVLRQGEVLDHFLDKLAA